MERMQMFFGRALALLVLLSALVLTSQSKVFADTAAGWSLTNIATVSWGTGGSNGSQVAVRVETNYGGIWIGQGDGNVTAGNSITNATIFTNLGNANADYIFSYTVADDATNVGWTVNFTNTNANAAEGASITVADIAPASTRGIWMLVDVPAAATNGSFVDFVCFATNSTAVADGATAVAYTGVDGSTAYGGTIGLYGAGGNVVPLSVNGTLADSNWLLTVQAAVMELVKTVDYVDNPSTYADGAAVQPIPGAEIYFKIEYVNSGAATAEGVEINDTLPSTILTYNTGTMKHSGTTTDDWAGAPDSLTDTDADGDAAGTADNINLVFTPNGSPSTPGDVSASEDGAFYYRAYLQ